MSTFLVIAPADRWSRVVLLTSRSTPVLVDGNVTTMRLPVLPPTLVTWFAYLVSQPGPVFEPHLGDLVADFGRWRSIDQTGDPDWDRLLDQVTAEGWHVPMGEVGTCMVDGQTLWLPVLPLAVPGNCVPCATVHGCQCECDCPPGGHAACTCHGCPCADTPLMGPCPSRGEAPGRY